MTGHHRRRDLHYHHHHPQHRHRHFRRHLCSQAARIRLPWDPRGAERICRKEDLGADQAFTAAAAAATGSADIRITRRVQRSAERPAEPTVGSTYNLSLTKMRTFSDNCSKCHNFVQWTCTVHLFC